MPSPGRRTAIAAVIIVALAIALLFIGRAHAQVGEVYRAAGAIATNVGGVHSFLAPPRGFDAIAASDAERAAYGLPPRPDPQAAPDAYKRWARAMTLGARKAEEPLRAMKMVADPARPVGSVSALAGAPATGSTVNWSGVVNGLPGVHSWNAISSVSSVVGEFNVPIAQQAFGSDGGTICAGDFSEVSWAGIDGWYAGDVLQGGSLSDAACFGVDSRTTYYCAWVEWYPTTPVLCQFTVNPGDDIYVEVWNTDQADGFVYLLDETQQVYTTVRLQVSTPPFLVGNSAEYIVERPSSYGTGARIPYPLMNYVTNFWGGALAYRFGAQAKKMPTQQYPGSRNATTIVVDMVDDHDTQTISAPTASGDYGIIFQTEGCALMGGCTP